MPNLKPGNDQKEWFVLDASYLDLDDGF